MGKNDPITMVDVNEPASAVARDAEPATNGIPQLDGPSTHRPALERMDNGLESTVNLKVIKVETNGNELFLTVEGDHPEDVTGSASKEFAYEERFQHGFADAGIEAFGGIQVIDGKSRHTWRLTRAL